MKSLLKDLKQPVLVAIAVGVFCIAYILLIGIPKTQAGAYLKQAKIQEGLSATKRADDYYKKAINNFPEGYILKEYELFKDRNRF